MNLSTRQYILWSVTPGVSYDYDPGDYPRFAVTVDIAVFTIRDDALQVLLIERGGEPFLGARALPGGFVRPDEDLDQAAARELAEETGLRAGSWHLEQLGTYGAPGRDPRMRVVTVAYWAICAELPALRGGGDAVSATLTLVEAIERRRVRLAFDHERIVRDAVERTRSKLEYTALAARFCPPEFTIGQLRRVYEAVWNTRLDPGNFQRNVQESGAFEKRIEAAAAPSARRGRPASLWSVSESTVLGDQPAVPLARPPAKRRQAARRKPTKDETPGSQGTSQMRPSDATERARGLMDGIAAGNLLGIVQEGWSRRKIAQAFPDGVREIAAATGYPDDDDLAQAIIIAEAAEKGPLEPDDLGRRFWEWAETNGLGMGGLTGHVLELYGGDVPQFLAARGKHGRFREPAGMPITEASQIAWGGSRAGNGAAMRCAPIAIRWRDDPVALVRNSIVSAVPTHWDKRCGWSCALLNLAAAAALRGESITADELLDAGVAGVRASLSDLERYGYDASMPESVREAVLEASDAEIAEVRLDGDSMGYTLLALVAGLIAFWRATSFEHTLSSVVEAGGDTDTNGAVVGAMLGARFGLGAIPRRWRDRIAEIRAGRTPMESLADRLLLASRSS